MNAKRDPDRMIQAWLDLMPDEAPDRAIAAVHQAVEKTPQVRRPLVPALWRFSPMNRLVYAAGAAAIIAVVVGGVLLFRPNSNVAAPATPSPAPSAAQSLAPALAPESLRSTWLADAAPAPSGDVLSFARLVFSAAGNRVTILESGVETFPSSPVVGPDDELDLVSTGPAGGCQIGDVGRYRFVFGSDGTVPASDGTLLGLTLVEDPCAARATKLARTWVHAIDANSAGGRGLSAAFNPMFLITLPAASYAASVGPDALTATSANPDRTLFAVHNPVGWTDPCSTDGGSKRPIEPTIAAFTAYLGGLPGFTVRSADLTIDGRPAVVLTVPSVETADCPSHRVNEWTSSDPADKGGWLLRQGETDVLYLVAVDGNLVLLQWLGAGVTTAEEQALFATVHFTDTLPQ